VQVTLVGMEVRLSTVETTEAMFPTLKVPTVLWMAVRVSVRQRVFEAVSLRHAIVLNVG